MDSLCGKRLRLGFNNKRETLSPVRCDYSSPRLIVLRNPTWPPSRLFVLDYAPSNFSPVQQVKSLIYVIQAEGAAD